MAFTESIKNWYQKWKYDLNFLWWDILSITRNEKIGHVSEINLKYLFMALFFLICIYLYEHTYTHMYMYLYIIHKCVCVYEVERQKEKESNRDRKINGGVGRAWESQLVQCRTLACGWDHDLRFLRSNPSVGSALSGESAEDSVSPCAPPPLICSLSQKPNH